MMWLVYNARLICLERYYIFVIVIIDIRSSEDS